MRRLVVQCVARGVVWVGGGWSLSSRAGSGEGVSLGGRGRGDSWWCVSAGTGGGGGSWGSPRHASVVCSRGGGGGGDGVGVALLVAGGVGLGWVLCWMGVWVYRRVVWVLRVRVVWFSRFLAGRPVEVGGGCLGIRMGLWSTGSGWLLVDGVRWHGLRVGGLPVVVGCSL